ncbi:hypothetical protein V8C26DRAFT_201764 [Trichoderma gracile]
MVSTSTTQSGLPCTCTTKAWIRILRPRHGLRVVGILRVYGFQPSIGGRISKRIDNPYLQQTRLVLTRYRYMCPLLYCTQLNCPASSSSSSSSSSSPQLHSSLFPSSDDSRRASQGPSHWLVRAAHRLERQLHEIRSGTRAAGGPKTTKARFNSGRGLSRGRVEESTKQQGWVGLVCQGRRKLRTQFVSTTSFRATFASKLLAQQLC